ncbi:MAG TPA: LodA/GoxA family CTQ-dependent oxidase [Thermoanaerobaculia bacterium]|nr:LodA/GoxA family CTQ-dependent oxidase [Thermoanaerobaculia bacterium]
MSKARNAVKAAAAGPGDSPEIDREIAYCMIHPGVGIARFGNSPDEYFLGPRTPGETPSPEGGFKDRMGRIKRQGAEFRIYGYNAAGVAVKEITADDADVTWTVHLANRKAEYDMFLGSYWQSQYPEFYEVNQNQTPPRNQEVTGEDRKLLIIDPGPRSISGRQTKGVRFDGGTIGPLPYTVTTPGKLDDSNPEDVQVDPGNAACLKGSRVGYLNTPYKRLGNEPAAGCTWIPGVMIPPVVMSPEREVQLGELRTDDQGRLIVLGGFGQSGSLIPNNPIGFLNLESVSTYANNDYWYDDSSDGPVSATVTLKDGGEIPVKDKAWVLVAPPKYAPSARVLTTLYEVAMTAWEQGEPPPPEKPVSFTRDIYPVFARLQQYHWLNATVYRGHGTGAGQAGDFIVGGEPLPELREKGEANRYAKQHVFKRLRKPDLLSPTPDAADTQETLKYANYQYMPQMSGDGGEPLTPPDIVPGSTFGPIYPTWLTLTARRYACFERWANDDYEDDWQGVPPVRPLWDYPVAEQPGVLDHGALDPCVGGAFYPGIEITYIARDKSTWSGPCRINQDWLPGYVTRHMALPWQADFAECNTNWWPAARPDDVVPVELYEQVLATYDPAVDGPLEGVLADRVPWARGLPPLPTPVQLAANDVPLIDNAMVIHWKDLGFIVPRTYGEGPDAQVVYIETERSPYIDVTEREAFYLLMNIVNYPEFIPTAHQMVENYLTTAQSNANAIDPDELFGYFDYTPWAFNTRLQAIYDNFVRDNESPEVYADNISQTREDVIFEKLQLAPFNQLDGAWLRHVTPDGPLSSVSELLARIRQDELGDGDVAQNHANVYTDLLKSVNIYLPDLYTRAYAYEPRFLDSAFTQPVFLLAISQFNDEFFPEILGMTLELEWGSVSLKTTVDELEAFGINPLYYSLHVGIDNASVGHGALAKEAVEMYLDIVRQNEGEAAMQEVWRRIWTGYIAFATLGTLNQDVSNFIASPPTLTEQMVNMIQGKAQYASLMHGDQMLGDTRINDWFEDPSGLLVQLQDSGIVIPGRPDISPIFQLMSFNGPMFHVFTDEEQALWRDWILSLTLPQPPDAAAAPYLNMLQVVDVLRQRQQGVTGHNVLLIGPDPEKEGEKITRSIHWWFDLGDDVSPAQQQRMDDLLLGAISDEANGWIVKGNPAASPLITSLVTGDGEMAQVFRTIAPGTITEQAPLGLTFENIIVQWVQAGCPIGVALQAALPAAFAAAARKPRRRPHRKPYGMGVVH